MRRTPYTNAFSLAELVVALAVMGVLMTGIGSAILVASHALPDDGDVAAAAAEAATTLDMMIDELRSATWISEHTATAITFTVPDRDGDGNAEQIRYTWGGTPGDPVTKEYNGGGALTVLDNVHDLSLAYELAAVVETYPGAPVESDEGVLASYDTITNPKGFQIQASNWLGQHFKPDLPSDAISWSVTRVLFIGRQEGLPLESMWAQLRPANGWGGPNDVVLDQTNLLELSLPVDFAWIEAPFNDAAGLPPDQELCFVLQHSGLGGSAARVRYEDGTFFGRVRTTNAGADWSLDYDKSMYYYVYGTSLLPGPDQTATRYYITNVGANLQVGDDAASAVTGGVQTLNVPELLSGSWDADFDTDPTVDGNGDGTVDWAAKTGSFDDAALSDGVWTTGDGIYTSPGSNFTGLTTVELRWRNVNVGPPGAVFEIPADRSVLACAPLSATLTLEADGTQTLTISRKTTLLSSVTLLTVPGLSGGFVDLRLVIDPTLDTISVSIDNRHVSTLSYTRIVPLTDDDSASVYADGSDIQVDKITIRVSE